MLRAGEIVRGPQWPETVEIKKCEPSAFGFYLVEALGRDTRAYYETLLEEFQFGLVERLSEGRERPALSAAAFQRYLQYLALEEESKFSKTRALGSHQVIPLPHQIEAVYGRMLQSPQVRYLLADDPGAGKTIMAGMLLRELQARGMADRILILVPPLVLVQWRDELLEKFSLDFQIISRTTVSEAGGKNPFVEYPFCLASIYWASRDDVTLLVRDASFDLVIVDEAHKMAAYTQGKKVRKIKRTKLYQLGESILRHAPHRLLLTATPHKGDMENFRHLMQLIDQDIFSRFSAEETLRDKVNPFIIRRLKERMVHFDGTPIFPPRTVKTIEFELSPAELDLYEAVTEYVRRHFNQAARSGNNRIAFTMMLLQRRLSSSLEAIHLSLERRHEKIVELIKATLEERERLQEDLISFDPEQYEEETPEAQSELEEKAELVFEQVNLEELEREQLELELLLEKSALIRMNNVERKYQELEETIFGENGLLNKGEKILIFTEARDTLLYLERRLLGRVPRVAKIEGSFSMEQRREQVELFRTQCSIMLATDAGGESINLQFCNQMINYDMPWNPNKLEQRMGRIHRIGQKNEVFVFNLVAGNTREGDVMRTLLKKIEQMRKDLGRDLVYDFIGDVLEDNEISLAELMQECVLNRQNLDRIIEGIDRVLSKEHQSLLQVAAEERLDEESIDLPGMRREQNTLFINRVPSRVYAQFTKEALTARKVAIAEGESKDYFRIEHFPKSVRDFARRESIRVRLDDVNYRLTGNESLAGDNTELLSGEHPLYKLAMALTRQEWQSIALDHIEIGYPTKETLLVEVYEVSIVDGTGRELARELLHIARRENGSFIYLNPYWLYSADFSGVVGSKPLVEEEQFRNQAIHKAMQKMVEFRNKREEQLNKKSQFLRRAFEAQYRETMRKLTEYRATNVDNRFSALINQMNAQLIEIEERREQRITEIERERSIQMRPTRQLLKITLRPGGSSNISSTARSIHEDWIGSIQRYELLSGRTNLQVFDEFGMVDFYSETPEGEPRLIITTDNPFYQLSREHRQDLGEWVEKTYLYYVENKEVVWVSKILD